MSKLRCENPIHLNKLIERNPGPNPINCKRMCKKPHLELTIELSEVTSGFFPAHFSYFIDGKFYLFVEKGGHQNYINLKVKSVDCAGNLQKINSNVNIHIYKNNILCKEKSFYKGEMQNNKLYFNGLRSSYNFDETNNNFMSEMSLQLVEGIVECPIRFIRNSSEFNIQQIIIKASDNKFIKHYSYPIVLLTKCRKSKIEEINYPSYNKIAKKHKDIKKKIKNKKSVIITNINNEEIILDHTDINILLDHNNNKDDEYIFNDKNILDSTYNILSYKSNEFILDDLDDLYNTYESTEIISNSFNDIDNIFNNYIYYNDMNEKNLIKNNIDLDNQYVSILGKRQFEE